MRVIDVGAQPVGLIAIGANATGVIAVGQLSTGVVAIGQLARGGIVIGQLSIGVVAVGQLAVGVGWAAGMVGLGGTSGPGLIFGAFGRLFLTRLFGRGTGSALEDAPGSPYRMAVAAITVGFLVALWWIAAGASLWHDLTRTGGILVSPPHVLR
ncbi:MAG: hypothetical protein JOZ37_17505 [Actinobacteria bacterium]|nr:hypothetical protein [Actinomycetota bacterium]MBV8958227.1 hypothetical protein [Actinomycetota bacterium]MBV9255985.1 hypothetical protein [Actinomycetota bacterium]MBV9665766.1 hypothetical protein [Actinomycetota bacterium]MBV9933927.1 hypothetical protein [Actinomycetota bacterium]